MILWFIYEYIANRKDKTHSFFKQKSKPTGIKESTEEFEFTILHKIQTTAYVIIQLWLP
jgi:hypothetical protein